MNVMEIMMKSAMKCHLILINCWLWFTIRELMVIFNDWKFYLSAWLYSLQWGVCYTFKSFSSLISFQTKILKSVLCDKAFDNFFLKISSSVYCWNFHKVFHEQKGSIFCLFFLKTMFSLVSASENIFIKSQ